MRLDFRVQVAVLTDISHQFGVLDRLRVLGLHQPVDESKFRKLGDHIVYRVVHRIHRIDQRRVPVEHDCAGVCVGEVENAH